MKLMSKEEWEARAKELESYYPDMSLNHMIEAAENIDSFGEFEGGEFCEESLDAYSACLEGTYEQYYH